MAFIGLTDLDSLIVAPILAERKHFVPLDKVSTKSTTAT
jgi:hypothetical protein